MSKDRLFTSYFNYCSYWTNQVWGGRGADTIKAKFERKKNDYLQHWLMNLLCNYHKYRKSLQIILICSNWINQGHINMLQQNSEQCRPLSECVFLIWVHIVCPGLSIPKFRVNMVNIRVKFSFFFLTHWTRISCIPDKDIRVFHLCLQIVSHPCHLTQDRIKIMCI